VRPPYSILVAGAGTVGLLAVLRLLASRNAAQLDVTIVDAGAAPEHVVAGETGLRVSAISAGSADLLESLGAWQRMHPTHVAAFDRMRVWDAASDPHGGATLRFDADEFGVPHLGYIVDDAALREALRAAIEAAGAGVRFDTAVADASFDDAGARVRFADGGELTADLVIAADGGGSPLRRQAGVDTWEQAYDQVAFVTHLEPTVPHGDTAWQRFLPTGPLGLLPLADGRVSVVWTTTPEAAEQAYSMSDDGLGSLLTDASDGVLGDLRASGPRGRFPLVARHARRYVRRGFALVGDAAHTVHPLAGQGANLGIADVAELTGVIDAALDHREHPGDLPVLRRYERARRSDNARMLHFMTGLNRLFASDSGPLGELRRNGMALFNRSGPIRRKMAGVALGTARRK